MSLLSTFGILFETDAEKAKREIDGVDKSLSKTEGTANDTADSFDELSVATDDSAASFFGLSEEMAVAASGLVVVLGLFAGVTSQALGTDELGKFSAMMGLSIEEVDSWGEAVIRAGGTAEGFRGSLQSLTGQLTDISLTGSGAAAEVLARLGINAMTSGGQIKSAFDILPQLADSFQRLSRAESVGFGQKLGLDQGTILLLQQGRVAVEDLVRRQRELGVTTEEDAKAAADFNDQMADSKQSMRSLFTTAGTTILPLLTQMLKGFQVVGGWMRQHKNLVAGFFIATGVAITVTYLPAITAAAIATWAVIAPFLAVAAVIGAVGVGFALLYEDVVAYIGGQQSFIGDLAKKYEWFGAIVKGIADGVNFAMKEMSEFTGEMFKNMQGAIEFLSDVFSRVFGGITDEFSTVGLDMNKVVAMIIHAFGMLGDAIAGTLGVIASPIESTKTLLNEMLTFLPDVGKGVDDALSGMKSLFGFGDDEINANIDKALTVQSSIDSNPLNGQTSASIVNSASSVSRVNNINVGGSTINTQATDAVGINDIANKNLTSQVEMAIAQLDDAEAY